MAPLNGRNNSHGNGKSARQLQKPDLLTTVYQPSIYRYTCRGAFFLSSEDDAKGKNEKREGTCRGIRSQIEMLQDLEKNTRAGAIKNFTYMTDYELDESESGLDQQTKSIVVSPALIYKDDDEGGAVADPNTGKIAKKNQQLLPEEELIKRQEWSCYGRTDVEYLVLRNPSTGDEKIAAVVPHNAGISIRKIEADDGGSITSVALRWLNLVVDSGPSIWHDEEESSNNQASAAHHQHRDQKGMSSMNQSSKEQISPAHQVASSSVGEGKPPPDNIDQAKESVTKVYKFSCKLANHMQYNATWLAGTVQDNFGQRTITAGTKIVQVIPKTVEKTGKFFGKMVGRLLGGDDDHNNK